MAVEGSKVKEWLKVCYAGGTKNQAIGFILELQLALLPQPRQAVQEFDVEASIQRDPVAKAHDHAWMGGWESIVGSTMNFRHDS
ncbi:hypothetical protein VNO80_13533 [Phaseolus coccineus]|uniref:Uncharacterized protein n=1 Tax=Phaseolus coccineus TaxID=3886 RepID=A0AAN9RA23_PHACN